MTSETWYGDHNFGPKCRLAPVAPPVTPDDDDVPPHLHAQFFYSSAIPIDDPLSSGAIAGAADAKASKGNLRPFSPGDNNALQKAWFSLISHSDQQLHRYLLREQADAHYSASKILSEKTAALIRHLACTHKEKHDKLVPQDFGNPLFQAQLSISAPTCCAELLLDVSNELAVSFCSLVRQRDPSLSVENVAQEVMTELRRVRSTSKKSTDPSFSTTTSPGIPLSGPLSPRRGGEVGSFAFRRTEHDDANVERGRVSAIDINVPRTWAGSNMTTPSATPASTSIPARLPNVDAGISGMPFVRVGSLDPYNSQARAPSPALDEPPNDTESEHGDIITRYDEEPASCSAGIPNLRYGKDITADVAVGISRLHMVSLPVLQMKPIYWSPINDLAIVTRATWFYRDTMLPTPSLVANQLEAGYHELRPYSQTWQDELRCAIEIGPAGEEKVSHQLWPKDPERVDVNSAMYAISNDQYCASRCFGGHAAAEGSTEPVQPNQSSTQPPTPRKPFANYHVIYKDGTEAYLLKPNLKPSAYYGRRPVSRILKDLSVGIPVARGFNRAVWNRLYDKKTTKPKQQEHETPNQHAEAAGTCGACRATNDKGQVTDLILVAHGIGQKLAERVESFHFTHAINAFRCAVNLELGKPAVKQVLREGQNGIMVLPINWRHTLSFEDGGPMREEDKSSHVPDGFGLKNIEPRTIPAVRSLISDIMFDIPFYMSHHKGKMIQALVTEANRVYRLWCRNNPGFQQNGKVHMIAHSLGSVMALDILSRQPTIPPPMDPRADVSQTKHFEFDTKYLFFCGSPAGFFLLLERGALIPRRGRHKPGVDSSDAEAKDVVGDVGTFGCLAVDNIYNILAKEDPIAYFLNGTIDPTYAAGLKTAYVPSTAVSLFKSVSDAMRGMVGSSTLTTTENDAHPPTKPPTLRLPSQLELEVHDFNREEVAEQKAYLLNDNGQIDYFLRSGGGPLEIQYLNMLSAHSSYWYNNDFIRLLCTEIGRAPGRENTLPEMRAAKASKTMIPPSS